MPKRESWYDKGFREAREGLPSDPPWEPGHRDFTNYMSGFVAGIAEAEAEQERDGQCPAS